MLPPLSLFLLLAVPGWQASFEPATLSTYLDSEGLSVLVAAAGDRASDARPARRSLVAALRATGKTRAVLDEGPLGDLSGLDDAHVVERGRRLPVDVILVIRVFPGAEGQAPTAVVTSYSRATGATLSALTVQRGFPLEARNGGQALPSTAEESVTQLVRQHEGLGNEPPPPPPGSPEAKCQERAILRASAGTVGSRVYYYQGQQALDLPTLFGLLGRLDLAASYGRRSTTKRALVGSGVTAMVLGVAVAIAGAFVQGSCTTIDTLTGNCTAHQSGDASVAAVGGGVFLAGLIATAWGAALRLGLLLVSRDGLVLTNAHVVENAARVDVVLHDGRRMLGDVVERGVDDTDVALVQLPLHDCPVPELGGQTDIKVGSWVGAIGHGAGAIWTFNSGMVSNIYPSGAERPVFQTQIPINAGNSGGPIFTSRGRIVGLVTAKIQEASDLNFGIALDVARRALWRLARALDCLLVLVPPRVPVFVDGAMVGTGPRVAAPVRAGAEHDVFAVIQGKMVRRRVRFPDVPWIDLTKP